MVGVLSQEQVSEPLSVDWSPFVSECEPIRLDFRGGLPPYDIYVAVAHAVDNNSTWSEEHMFSTVGDNFRIWVTPDVANFTDTIRFRVLDIAGDEEDIWIKVIGQSSTPCDPTSATSIDQNLSTNTLEDETTTIKDPAHLSLGLTSIHSNVVATEPMSTPAFTGNSQQPPSSTLQAGATMESPAEETQNGGDQPPSASPTANTDTYNTQRMGVDGASNGSMTAESPNESGNATPLASSAYHEPTNHSDTNNSVSSHSNKRVRLSREAAGVIGATTGCALVVGIAFAWYRRQRSVSFKGRRADGYLDI